MDASDAKAPAADATDDVNDPRCGPRSESDGGAPFTMMVGLGRSQGHLVDDAVYMGDVVIGWLMKCGLLGCTFPEWFTSTGGPGELVFDGPDILYTRVNNPPYGIYRCTRAGDCDGGGPGETAGAISSFAVDSTTLFMADFSNHNVTSCSKTQCDGGMPLTRNLQLGPHAVRLDEKNVYWSVFDGADGAIRMCPKTGCPDGGAITVVADAKQVRGLVISGDRLLWTELASGLVRTCLRHDCSNPTVIADGQLGPRDLAWDGCTAYWANDDLDAGSIMRSSRPNWGSPPVPVALGERGPSSLSIDQDHVYWTTSGTVNDAGTTQYDGELRRAPR